MVGQQLEIDVAEGAQQPGQARRLKKVCVK